MRLQGCLSRQHLCEKVRQDCFISCLVSCMAPKCHWRGINQHIAMLWSWSILSLCCRWCATETTVAGPPTSCIVPHQDLHNLHFWQAVPYSGKPAQYRGTWDFPNDPENFCHERSDLPVTSWYLFIQNFPCSLVVWEQYHCPIEAIQMYSSYVWASLSSVTDASVVMAAHRPLLSTMHSNADNDWPFHSLMLSFHDLHGLSNLSSFVEFVA